MRWDTPPTVVAAPAPQKLGVNYEGTSPDKKLFPLNRCDS